MCIIDEDLLEEDPESENFINMLIRKFNEQLDGQPELTVIVVVLAIGAIWIIAKRRKEKKIRRRVRAVADARRRERR